MDPSSCAMQANRSASTTRATWCGLPGRCGEDRQARPCYLFHHTLPTPTQVSIRQLKQIHSATVPAPMPLQKVRSNFSGEDAIDLLAAPEAEAEQDK